MATIIVAMMSKILFCTVFLLFFGALFLDDDRLTHCAVYPGKTSIASVGGKLPQNQATMCIT